MTRIRYVPNLLRGVTIGLVLALADNLWLLGFSNRYWFTWIIALGSGAVALILVTCYMASSLTQIRDDAYLASFAVWLANTIEIAGADHVSTPGRYRSAALYLALAIISLSAYLRVRVAREDGQQ